jgi:hypothetical protein
MSPGKHLYYFNILHSEEEIGLQGRSDKEGYDLTWERIIDRIAQLHPPPVKMYNDTLWIEHPSTLYPPEKVPQALAEYDLPEGHNKRILLHLAGKGASLVPCEDKALLVKWMSLDDECLEKEAHGTLALKDQTRRYALLMDRNRFIAQRVADTLNQGEYGILFLGYVHNVYGIMVTLLEGLGLSVVEFNPEVRYELKY